MEAEGWKDALQLLKEQSEKMEKLARALSVIQQGVLRNNPRHVTDSVNKANQVLGGTLNTHRMPSGKRGENPKKNGISPRHEKIGDLSETAFGVSGRYPKKPGEGRRKICSLSPSVKNSQERKGWLFAFVRASGHEPAPE